MADKTEIAIAAINALEPTLIALTSLVANIVVLWQLAKAKAQRAEATAEVVKVKADVAEVKIVAVETKAQSVRTHDEVNHKMAEMLALNKIAAADEATLAEKKAQHIREGEAAVAAAQGVTTVVPKVD